MFASFFRSRDWVLWPGAIIIILGTWYQVQVDVAINEWFGSFYDMVQKRWPRPVRLHKQNFLPSFCRFLRSPEFM